MCIASGDFTTISCGVQPERLMSADCPEMMPPAGSVTTVVMPLTRVTSMRLL